MGKVLSPSICVILISCSHNAVSVFDDFSSIFFCYFHRRNMYMSCTLPNVFYKELMSYNPIAIYLKVWIWYFISVCEVQRPIWKDLKYVLTNYDVTDDVNCTCHIPALNQTRVFRVTDVSTFHWHCHRSYPTQTCWIDTQPKEVILARVKFWACSCTCSWIV